MNIQENLGIYIITYNRAQSLNQTLLSLLNSRFSLCEITVLDNCSSDGTENLCNSYYERFSSFKIARSDSNIGASANVMRAFTTAKKKYTWVLCDDDIYDFNDIDDLVLALEVGEAELIHVGGHPDLIRNGNGEYSVPYDLMSGGYQYFKIGSFLPANIFRTDFLRRYLQESFNYVYFMYPHMPVIIAAYTNNCKIYVTNKRLITATIGTQSYNAKTIFNKWNDMCLQEENKKIVKVMLQDQYRNEANNSGIGQLFLSAIRFGKLTYIISILRIFHIKCITSTIPLAFKKIKFRLIKR